MAGFIGHFLDEAENAGALEPSGAAAARERLGEAEGSLEGGRIGTVHTDLSFDNAIWDGEQVWLIDLEWACMAPLDYELVWLLGYCRSPAGLVEPEWEAAVRAADHSQVLTLLQSAYPQLFDHPRLVDRLVIYGLTSFARGRTLLPATTGSGRTTPITRRNRSPTSYQATVG